MPGAARAQRIRPGETVSAAMELSGKQPSDGDQVNRQLQVTL